MAFMKAAVAADVPEGKTFGADVGGTPVLLARVDGQVYAASDRCTHRGGTLSKGSFADGVVTCPRHGSRFDVRTGECLSGPKILMFKGTADDIQTYPVMTEGDDVMVDVG